MQVNKKEPIRGCGIRVPGGVYATTPATPEGKRQVEDFLLDPPRYEVPVPGEPEPMPVADAFGLSPIGVQLWKDTQGTTHLLDWVGEKYYPNVADFVEECRHLGVSRRVPITLDYSVLGQESRLLLFHNRGHIRNAFDYYVEETDLEKSVATCPRKRPEHARDRTLTMCVRLYWQDIEGGELVSEGSRGVKRSLPSFDYDGFKIPELVEPQYAVALFAAFPIVQLEVIRSDDGRHEDGLEAASKSGIRVALSDY